MALTRPPEEVRFLVRVTNIDERVELLDDDPGFDYEIPWESAGDDR